MSMKNDRSKFVYDLDQYGKTTDIYALPIGTRFSVVNGAWRGRIIQVNGEKSLQVDATGKTYRLQEDVDYGLSIIVSSEYDPSDQNIARCKSCTGRVDEYGNSIE